MKQKATYIFLLLVLFHFFSFSQNQKIDSLLFALKNSKPDTIKVNLLNELALKYVTKNSYEQGLQHANEALRLSKELNYKNGMADALKNSAFVYYYKGNYRAMLEYLQKALPIRKESGNKNKIAGLYSNIGVAHWSMGDYVNAQQSYINALKIAETMKDKDGIATIEINLGILCWSQGKYEEALKYYERSLKVNLELGDKRGVATAYANIANVYHSMNDSPNALEYNTKALQLREELLDSNEISDSYNNIANVLTSMKLFEKAYEYEKRGLFIKRKLGDKNGEALLLLNIGSHFLDQNKISDALSNMNDALALAKETEDLDLLKNVYEGLTDVYIKAGKHELALQNYMEHIKARDSLKSGESIRKMTEAQMNYEFEKKQREEQLIQQQKDELTKAEEKKQNLIRNFFIGGFILVLIAAVFIFRSLRQTRKANKTIAAQKLEVELQKTIVEQKNKDITDSINYAQIIQEAVFPAREIKYRLFPDAFVYFKPRDIVSGDFYWFAEKNGKRFIAAVDCTGHGVPGAFMSIIGNHLLNEIVLEKGILHPSEILDLLHTGVRDVLKQEDQKKQSPDGMDIALCCFDTTTAMEFSGAHRPLYIVSDGVLKEIKSDKFPIGGSDANEGKKFTNHHLNLKKGDAIYIFSDGYADQFGGTNGKKLMSKNFKELLLANANLTMPEQEKLLDTTIEKWKGNREQVDDVLVIGIKI